MSSTYCILKKGTIYLDVDYVVIGRTGCFTQDGDILKDYLPDNTPIICIDNDSNITTLKELKEYYSDF